MSIPRLGQAVLGPQLDENFKRFLMGLKLTQLAGSFSETWSQSFYLKQITGSDYFKRQKPILGIYESQLGFTVLLFGL